MSLRVIFVMTHDSIGLGEDGPTHQPVEHLSSLRAIPNLNVFRPCDIVETIECWSISIKKTSTPSVLSLSRQGLPCLRLEHTEENLSSKGGYIISEAENDTKIILIASGSEVSIALEAQELLNQKGIFSKVVSMPCLEIFESQESDYRQKVIDPELPVVVIEAAVSQSWGKYLGMKGKFIGMKTFGASAPSNELYEHFEITAQKVVKAVEEIYLEI